MKNNLSISLIVPCYNESTNIQTGVLDKIGNFTHEDPRFIEVLIVDDGSNDHSRDLIKREYLPHFPKFRLIENPHQGKAYSVITGIQQAKGESTMFMDIDLATPLEETEKLVKYINEGYEIIIGSRNTHREGAPLSRKIQSVGFIIIRDVFIGLKGIRDTQCGFKLFQKKAALDTLSHMQIFTKKRHVTGAFVSAGFDLEFLFVAKKRGYKIKEVPVEWRHVGSKHVTFFKDTLQTLKDLIRIKYYDLTKKYDQS